MADVKDDEERREKQRIYSQGYFKYQAKVIADRRVNPRDDLVTLLTTGEVDGYKLNDEEVLQESLLILIGGDETTRHVMSGGLARCSIPIKSRSSSTTRRRSWSPSRR